MSSTHGYAAHSATTPLVPFDFTRRRPGAGDVVVDIDFCGVCHSDLHTVRNEWGNTLYPCVPGHEIIGRVREVGNAVKKFRAGQRVGVGVLVDSCRTCSACGEGLEQYCENGFTLTYNSPDAHLGGHTLGGYSSSIVVDERFVLSVSDRLDPAGAAPLLCAGITTWSPLRHWKIGKGSRVAVVGLGGLGHMGVKFARSLGAHVVVCTTSPSKVQDAMRLGAHEVIVNREPDACAKHANSLHFVLDTVSAVHELDPLLSMLRRDGTLCFVGLPEKPFQFPVMWNVVTKRRAMAGSIVGGMPETQQMLDYCAEHGITSDVERIAMREINTAYERMLRSDVKYRFVIDMARG